MGTLFLTKEARIYNGEKTASSISGARKTGQIHVKESFVVHGILPTRMLEWVAMPRTRGSSQPKNQTHASYITCTGSRIFTTNTPWEAMVFPVIISRCESWTIKKAKP